VGVEPPEQYRNLFGRGAMRKHQKADRFGQARHKAERARASGMTPPRIKIGPAIRRRAAGAFALSPAAIDPRMKPVNISPTRQRTAAMRRIFGGERDRVRQGAPDRRSPERKRRNPARKPKDSAAMRRLQSPSRGTQASSSGRLPKRSARGATKIAPSNKPNKPNEKNSPRFAGVR